MHSHYRCFHGFKQESNLRKHEESCIRFKPQGIKFPEEEKLYFKGYDKMVQSPVYIVAGNIITRFIIGITTFLKFIFNVYNNMNLSSPFQLYANPHKFF